MVVKKKDLGSAISMMRELAEVSLPYYLSEKIMTNLENLSEYADDMKMDDSYPATREQMTDDIPLIPILHNDTFTMETISPDKLRHVKGLIRLFEQYIPKENK